MLTTHALRAADRGTSQGWRGRAGSDPGRRPAGGRAPGPDRPDPDQQRRRGRASHPRQRSALDALAAVLSLFRISVPHHRGRLCIPCALCIWNLPAMRTQGRVKSGDDVEGHQSLTVLMYMLRAPVMNNTDTFPCELQRLPSLMPSASRALPQRSSTAGAPPIVPWILVLHSRHCIGIGAVRPC